MKKGNRTICQYCGKSVEYKYCIGGFEPPYNARCKAMNGWLSVFQWQGMGVVNHQNFCSLACLQNWIQAHISKVPMAFIKAFDEDEANLK